MPYARVQLPVQDENGKLVTQVWCEVRREELAGSPIEPLFMDRMGDTPMSNPFYAVDGIIAFHSAGGAFRIRVYKAGYDETWRYVKNGLGGENDLQGFVPMGAWDDETIYAIGDVVTRPNGPTLHLFASKVNDNVGEEPNATGPADSAFWAYLGIAVAGLPGPPGLIGNWRGAWATLNAYDENDAVRFEGSSYIALESHTAGDFSTDLAADKWDLVVAKGDHGDLETVEAGTGIEVDDSDSAHPEVSVKYGNAAGTAVQGNDARLTAWEAVKRFTTTFGPTRNQPPAANFATIDTRNGHPVLDFDTATQEIAIFSDAVPDAYDDASGFTVDLHWSATSAVTGTIGWDVAFEKVDGQDLDADSFATAKTVTATTVPATSGEVKVTSVAFAHNEIDGLVSGDAYRIRIRRDVANDNAAGDAELVRAVVRQT